MIKPLLMKAFCSIQAKRLQKQCWRLPESKGEYRAGGYYSSFSCYSPLLYLLLLPRASSALHKFFDYLNMVVVVLLNQLELKTSECLFEESHFNNR